MVQIICLLLPPLLLMYFRKYLTGALKEFELSVKTAVEYLITLLLFTFLNFLVLVIVFHHTGEFDNAFSQHSEFTMHYLCMSVFFAFAIPLGEKLFRGRVNIKVTPFTHTGLNTDRFWDICLWVYSCVLILINFIRCFDNALWGDEAFTAGMAKETLSNMVARTAADVHPPLYYVFTQIAFRIAGDSGFAYHFVSFLAYLIIIILGLTVIKKVFGRNAALLLITFSSLTGYAVTYNIEIRMYSWAELFVFVSYLSSYYILKNNSWKSWALFVAASLCAAYTHYYALIMVAVFYACFILLSFWKKKFRIKTFIASIITIVGYLPWLLVLLRAFGRTASSWWLNNIPSLKDCFLAIFAYKWMFPVLVGGFVVFALYETSILKIELPNCQEWKTKENVNVNVMLDKSISITDDLIFVVMGILSALGTIAVGLILSYAIRPFFDLRYLWPIAPVMYLVLGQIVSKLKLRNIWCAMIISMFLLRAVPSYCGTYKAEAALNRDTTEFQKNVVLSSSDYILTNSDHHAWTILSYYYPEIEVRNIKDGNVDVDTGDKNVWILWTSELSEDILEYYDNKQESCVMEYQGRLGNGSMLFIYKVKRGIEK